MVVPPQNNTPRTPADASQIRRIRNYAPFRLVSAIGMHQVRRHVVHPRLSNCSVVSDSPLSDKSLPEGGGRDKLFRRQSHRASVSAKYLLPATYFRRERLVIARCCSVRTDQVADQADVSVRGR